MMSTTSRRSTRRKAPAAASVDSAQSGSDQGTPTPELRKKKGRKQNAASTNAQPQTVTQSQKTVTGSQQTVTKTSASSRTKTKSNATTSSTTTSSTAITSSTATSSTVTTQAPSVPRKLTRASRAAIVEAGGQPSPQRSLEDVRPAKRAGSPAPSNNNREKRRRSPNDQENEDGLAPFFTTSKDPPHPNIDNPPSTASESQQEDDIQRMEIDYLYTRVKDLEAQNRTLVAENQRLVRILCERDQQILEERRKNLSLTNENFRLRHPTPDVSYGPAANHFAAEFDGETFGADESAAVEPVFINGNASAHALLHKIEQSAKEARRAVDKSETLADNHVNTELPQSRSAKRTFTEASATPDRPVENSNIFSRSFSAIKSRLFSTPKPQPTPEVASPIPATSPTSPTPLPPSDTWAEVLSIQPTPVGKRVQTPQSKRRSPDARLTRTLLRGVEPEDRPKAEKWAKQVIAELRGSKGFREKRTRLETPTLFKDLITFPSSKPWETGFGDPLGDLDDDDVVPVWAVWLDMKAEDDQHRAKRRRKSSMSLSGQEVPTIDEQFAASTGAQGSPSAANNVVPMSPKFYNSHGQSTSRYDLHPRRSVDPSPLFSNSLSHKEGANVFRELQEHDTAAQIRENDRQTLKSAMNDTVHTQPEGSVGMTFSVPDDSDEDDSTEDVEPVGTKTANTETASAETAGNEADPIWTQPPPPAPVPAHAPLPGGSPTDEPLSPPSQQPVDEIERQRQKLMKHTPAKPSRLREAIFPSPSVLSDIGNESLLGATPAPVTTSVAAATADSVNPMFDDIPEAEPLGLDAEAMAGFEEFQKTDEYKQMWDVEWSPAIMTYSSDEEELSPPST